MSQSHRGIPDAGARGPADDGEKAIESRDDVHGILTALEDSDCRALLTETAAETLTASELADRCSLPLSTTYRKLELLTDAGLLEERTRLRQTGKHVSEYALLVDDLTVSIDAHEGIQMRVSHTEKREESLQF